MLQNSSPSLYFKNTVPRVSLFFTLSATLNTVHELILRACKYIKSETRKLPFFRLKKGSSIAEVLAWVLARTSTSEAAWHAANLADASPSIYYCYFFY
jgi:hypothetical protein